jgi:hypothetical protein
MTLFSDNNRDAIVEPLIASIDNVLSQVGFTQSSRGEWERKSNWKLEEIDLRIREMSSQGLQPAFRVAIPRSDVSPLGDKYRYIAEVKLPQIIDKSAHPSAHISFPSFGFQTGRFVAKMASNIQRSLHWFQQFETPDLCKKNLKLFIKPGCPAYVDAEMVLDKVYPK